MLTPLIVCITTNCGIFLKRWKISLRDGIYTRSSTCFLRILYAGQEATVKPHMEQRTSSKLGKEYIKLCIVTLLFNLRAEYIMQNARLYDSQAGIKIAGEISATSDMQMVKVKRK